MHQSIPFVPRTPLGYCRAFVSPGGGAFANFVLPGGRAFANPRAIPKPLTHTWFPIRIKLHRGFYWKNKHIGSSINNRKKLKRVVKACSLLPWGIWQLKRPHPREFAIQGKKKNANARGSARGGGELGAAGIDCSMLTLFPNAAVNDFTKLQYIRTRPAIALFRTKNRLPESHFSQSTFHGGSCS